MTVLSTLRNMLSHSEQNVGKTERTLSTLAGLGLALYSLTRTTGVKPLIAASAASLLYRGQTGYCHLYGALGMNSNKENISAEQGQYKGEGRNGMMPTPSERKRVPSYLSINDNRSPKAHQSGEYVSNKPMPM